MVNNLTFYETFLTPSWELTFYYPAAYGSRFEEYRMIWRTEDDVQWVSLQPLTYNSSSLLDGKGIEKNESVWQVQRKLRLFTKAIHLFNHFFFFFFTSKCTTLYLTLHQKPRWGESVTQGFSLQLSSLHEPDTLPSPLWISNHGHRSVVFTHVSVQLTFTLPLPSLPSVSVHIVLTFLLASKGYLEVQIEKKVMTMYGWASASHHCQINRNHPPIHCLYTLYS